MNEIQLARLIDQARGFVADEKPLHASQLYLRLISSEPGFTLPYIELASLYAETGMHRASVRLLRRAAEAMPDEPDIIFHLANTLVKNEEYDAALTFYKKLADRKLPQVHFNMGIAYFSKGYFAAAEEQFRLTMRYDPKFPKINESIGELLIKRQAYTEAVEFLRKGCGLDPYSAISHHLMGIAFSKLDQWRKASQEFVTAIDMNPKEASSWQLCGECLIQLKRFGEAEAYLRKALELNPRSAETLVDLGQISSLKGESNRAEEFIRRALDVDPANVRAREARWKFLRHRRQGSKK